MAGLNITHGNRGKPGLLAPWIPLRFSYNRNGIAYLGSGRVSDLSCLGVRFQTGTPPPIGVEVELRLAWPFCLPIVSPPVLLIQGVVLRTGSWGTVVRMHQFEFRQAGDLPLDQAAARVEPRRNIA